MIKLPDGEIRDYLPVTVKNDIDMVCLSYAIKKATERLLEYQEHTMVYSFIESMPEQICDIMAADLRPPYYSDSMPLKVKREIIKNTLAWYMTAGTPAAIDGLLSTVFGWGKTEEWFEYGGRPYYFRLLIGIDADQKEVNIFLKSLNLVKNARSWLDAMVYSGVINHKDLENIILKNVLFRLSVPFWGCKLVNGTKLLDGTRHLNASRRYNLIPGITVPVHTIIAQEINIARIVINGMKVLTEEKTGAASVLRAAINSLPVKSSLPAKTGHISKINTPQNIDTSGLANNGIKIHSEEKTGAASGLKAGINHYKTPGGTRAVPARMWHKAAVVIHESIQGFTVVTEPVQVVFDSSGLANAGFEVVYNGNAVLNPGNLTVYKGDLITIKIQPDEHYSLEDGAYVFLSTGNTYVLDNCMATIKIKQECTARITAQVQNDKPTVNFMHDLNGCGFELEHNGKKYINPQSLVVTHGDEINIRLLTTHNGLFATMPGLTVNGKQEEFDCADINNINRYITVNDDMDIKIYTDYILGPYDPVYPDDDFDPAHADTPDVITAVDGDIYLSTRQTYSIILKYARSVTNFVIDARSYVQVSLQYTDNNGNLSDYNVQADNRMLCLVNFMYNRCKPGTDLKIDIKSLDYSIKSKIHIAYSTKLLPDCLTLKAKDNYEMTGVPAVVAITTDISSYSVRVSAKSNPSNASMSNPQGLKPDGIVIFKNPYSLVFIPSPLNGGYYDIYYFTRQG